VKEYELYVPLHTNEGGSIPPDRLNGLKRQLVAKFGGLTHFPQKNEGLWKIGGTTFRDEIVILRVLADETEADEFFRLLKKEMQEEWQQQAVLVVARPVETI
jgi:hypothetical protein